LLSGSTVLRPPRSPLFHYTTLFRSFRQASALPEGFLLRSFPFVPIPFLYIARYSYYKLYGALVASRAVRFSRILHVCRGACALRSEEHTSELQSRFDLVCRVLLDTT